MIKLVLTYFPYVLASFVALGAGDWGRICKLSDFFGIVNSTYGRRNLLLYRKATSPSALPLKNCNDGNVNTGCTLKSTHGTPLYWMVDLSGSYDVSTVIIQLQVDDENDFWYMANGLYVCVSSSKTNFVKCEQSTTNKNFVITYTCNHGKIAYVKVGNTFKRMMKIAEIEAYEDRQVTDTGPKNHSKRRLTTPTISTPAISRIHCAVLCLTKACNTYSYSSQTQQNCLLGNRSLTEEDELWDSFIRGAKGYFHV